MSGTDPTRAEIAAQKARQEAARDAYLLRKLGPDGVWKMQQEALSDLARLRPDLAERFRLPGKRPAE